MEDFMEVKPKGRPFKKIYLSLMLWFMGRAVSAASKVDDQVRREFRKLPEGFSFSLGVMPDGPKMVVGKQEDGTVRYMGGKDIDRPIDVKMNLKHIEAMFLLFSFQESTPVSNSRDRLFVEGNVPEACAVVRILDIVQVYLLPKFIAKLAVKRYPRWTLGRHLWKRSMVYFYTLTGL